MKRKDIRYLCAIAGASLGMIVPGSALAAATFDFDTGTPAVSVYQNVPFDQTVNGLLAHFSAVTGGFSLQTDGTLGSTLSLFSGKFLYPNSSGAVLDIQFSQPLTNITFPFATADAPPIEIPTPIVLTAYTNSASGSAVGSVTNRGAYGSDTWPMGTLTFASAIPFNRVRINIRPGGGMGFFVDNITVASTGVNLHTIKTSALPSAGGTTTGGGEYNGGANVTVVATANPGYAFVNWTESGTPVSTSASYSFTASADRTLVANFAPQLRIVLAASTAVVITWPWPSTGFVLQENPVCGQTHWSDTTNTVNVVGDNNQVNLSPLTENNFFRLFHP
jgi:hypothetical protein